MHLKFKFKRIQQHLSGGRSPLVFTLAFLLLFSLGTYAIAASGPFHPSDNVTDPDCYPGEAGCYVDPSVPSEINATLAGDGSIGSPFGIDLSHANTWLGAQTFNTDTLVLGNVYSKGTKWVSRASSSADYWTSATYGNGMFAAVSSTGTVMTSPDGIKWTDRATPSARSFNSITYGNGLFVAVAGNGTTADQIMTSPDGITWTSRTSPVARVWLSVTYGNGMFVAVADDGTTADQIMTSPDGITWTSQTSPAARDWLSVTYGNGMFVAVAGDGTTSDQIMTSADGITWTSQTSAAAREWLSVTYGNGMFVAVADNGTTADQIMTSPDGITWTSRTSPIVHSWNSVTYGNGMFVAVAGDGTTSDNVMTSGFPDQASVQNNNIYQGGITVTGPVHFPGLSTNSLVFTDGSHNLTSSGTVGVGQGGTGIASYTTGDLLYASSSSAISALSDVALGSCLTSGGVGTAPGWTACPGISGVVSTDATLSGNGTSGSPLSTVAAGALGNLQYRDGSGKFSGATYVKTDGSLTFGSGGNTALSFLDGPGFTINQFSGGEVFRMGNDGAVYLTAAASGLNLNGLGKSTLGDFNLAGNRTVAIVDDPAGKINLNATNGVEVVGDVFSKGTKWTSRTSPAANQWSSIAYGNGMFVAVAQNGTDQIMTSPDGITWTSRTAPSAASWTSVAYGNGLFVAVASDGTTSTDLMTSPDGINWTNRVSAAVRAWESVAYGNGVFVAVASNGLSDDSMISYDGINWTLNSTGIVNTWKSIAYGNGAFVVVASGGQGRRSVDGVTWVGVSMPAFNVWRSVTYGNGLFVAVSASGGASAVATSPDGINWTGRSVPTANDWRTIAYGNGLFVATAANGTTSNDIITSPDGITWTSRTSPSARSWLGLAYGNGMFVAVASDGTTSTDIMTSGFPDTATVQNNNIYQGGITVSGPITFSNLSSSLPVDPTGYVCYDTVTFALSYRASADCDTSSERFKHDIHSLSDNLDQVMRLRPVSYVSNLDDSHHIGFIAEEVAGVEPRLVSYEADGTTVHGLNYSQFAPLLAGAIQELDARFTSLDVNVSGSLASLVASFLGNAANGLRSIFVGEVHTDRLCVGATCLNEDQVKTILNSIGGGGSSSPSEPPAPSDPSGSDGSSDAPPSGDAPAGDSGSTTDGGTTDEPAPAPTPAE